MSPRTCIHHGELTTRYSTNQSTTPEHNADLYPCSYGKNDDMTMSAFNERLVYTYEHCSRHNVEIMLGDFNSRVSQ